MANEINQNQVQNQRALKSNPLSEAAAVLIEKSANTDDELIQALQNKQENRRAQQVFEWETTRRQLSINNWLGAV